MIKRVLMILALGAALVACSPTGSTGTDGTETLAPIESTLPTDGLPSEDPLASPSEDPLASPS